MCNSVQKMCLQWCAYRHVSDINTTIIMKTGCQMMCSCCLVASCLAVCCLAGAAEYGCLVCADQAKLLARK